MIVMQGTGSSIPYEFKINRPANLIPEAIEFNTVVSGTITDKGAVRNYTFTGIKGQQIFYDSLGGDYLYLTVIDPTGKVVLNRADARNDRGSDPSNGLTLQMDGTYKLIIGGTDVGYYSDYSYPHIGNYSFCLLDKATAPLLVGPEPVVSGTFDNNPLDSTLKATGANDYRFIVSQREYVLFDVQQGDGNWILYNIDGYYLNSASLNDTGNKREFWLDIGEYLLVMQGTGSNPNYKLKIVTPDQPVFKYTVGNTINGTITEPGQNDTYKFEGKAGQRLFFDSLSSTDNIFATLYSPSGKVVTDGITSLSSWDIRNNKVNNILDENGTYTLIIDPRNDKIGNYSLRLLEYANAASTAASQATPIALNTLISGEYDDPKGLKSNFYKFTASAGQTIFVDVTAGTYPNGYSVFSPNGEFVSGQNGIPFGQGYTSRSIVLPFTGDYTIEFYGTGNYSNTSVYDSRNDYSFQVLTPDNTDYNYTLGTSVNTAIAKQGEVDTYTFTGTIGQKLYFDYVIAPANERLKFYSPTRILLNERFLNSGDFLPETLKENGTYRIEISGDNGTTGAYGFSLSDRSSISIPEIRLGTTIIDTLNGNNSKLYRINGTQGQILNFDLAAPSWTGANWVLYDPAGVAISSTAASSPDFKITLPSTGLFTLAIGGANATNLNYNFTVTNIAPPPVTNNGLNRLQSGTLTASTPVNYTFSATAGTQIFYDGQDDSTNGYIRGRIYDPNGVLIADNLDLRYDLAPILLKETGNYKFQTYSYYSNITGDYKYNLLEMPNSFRSPAATYLALNGIETGTLNSGEAKVFTFQNFVGTKVLFNGMIGNGVNAYLYDPSGNIVMNFGNFQYTDSAQYVLTQSGLYHLAIAGDNGANRNYSFQMLDASSAPIVEYNLPTSGSLDNGQKDIFYKINASAGKRLYFDNLSATSTTDIYRFTWGLYAPDGSYVYSTNNYIYNDFQYDLTNSGEYTLVIRGQAATDKLDYKFRVIQTDINNARDIITPGIGKSNVQVDDGSLATVAIKLLSKDGKGGSAFQDYNIKLFADPDNANPVITSTPDTNYSLAEDGYRYTLTALDPNNDPLVYRLVNSPVGAIINRDTGELLWFPEANVTNGSKANFTVEVSDRRGGKDTQTFTVDVYNKLGKIQGAVFDDLNGNGLLDSKLIKGTNPAVIIAFDVSGSTEAPFYGTRNFPNVKVVKDAEVAAIKELAKGIIAQSQGNNVKIGLITFVAGGTIEDMDLSAAGLQEYTTALLDTNNNGITNLNEVLGQQIFADNKFYPPGRSGFDAALTTIRTLLQASSGTPNLIFMSDGYGQLDPVLAASVANDIKTGFGDPTRSGNVTALAIGEASTLDTLKEIDPNAIRLKDIESLTTLFSGLDESYNLEPFKENVSVYLDLNNNAVYDPNEPIQKTKRGFAPNSLDKTSYYYTFDNLLPGDYHVRILPPAGYKITTNYNFTTGSYDPATDLGNGILHRVTTAGESFADFFGVNEVTAPPNSDPKFVTMPSPITQLKSGELLKYNAKATDIDANPLTFDLVLAPDGMAVDANGTVIWNPTKKQVADYYAKLDADNQFLINSGRGSAVKTTVTFDALLRVRDGQGGQDIQYIKVELLRDNTPPVFTSTTPTANPQVGKTFRYQSSALDAENDTLTYLLTTGAPTGVSINSTTGLVTWTPTSSQLGSQEFSIKVTDGKGGEALQKVSLLVNPATPNSEPIITSTPRTQTRVGSNYYYRISATDPDGDFLSYSLQTAPTGMIITSDGIINWTPNASQFGNHTVAIKVSDGIVTKTQTFSLNVSNIAANYPPSITSAPNLVTNIERTYEYNLTGSDPDNDLLLWSLDAAPSGMVIDPQRGTLRWQPSSNQIGEHDIKVRLTDASGAFVGQEFTLTVTGTNIPSAIVSNPVTKAAINQLYTYTVIATDPENDPLTFSLGRKPAGMTITNDGTIKWTPQPNQIGSQQVEVFARDVQGAVTTQTYTIEVGATAINTAPSITSTPVYLAAVGSPYSYQVQANDPDAGDTLTYQLLSVPAGITGITIDPNTGLLTWNNPVAGNYKIVVGAVDAAGLGAAQGFTLTARVNNAPVIRSTPVLTATPGSTYSYDIIATDVDSDRLTYTLDQASRDLGMTLDALGRLRWTPTTGNVGSHHVVLTASDGIVSSPQEYNLVVAADDVAPKVRLIANYDQVELGESVTFQARATDNIKVAGLQLLIGDTPVVLDSNGMATFKPTTAGTITAKVIAKDAAGNVGQATFNVAVIDTSDVSAPDVSLNLGAIANGTVTGAVDIKGTVNDDNLDYYTLLVAPIGSSDFREIFRGTSTVNDGVLGRFDPSLLENDSYTLRLEAHDKGGNVSFVEDTVNVSGELKLGNFRLSFTDLSIPVTGIPITLTRTYDSLTSGSTDDFGYGWRMEFRDTDLRTSVGKPTGEVEELGGQNPFKDGTKVYIKLPGGKREGFTFKPTIDPLSQYLRGAGSVDSDPNIYHPSFVADAGVTDTLTVQNTRIIHGAGTNQYYGLAGSAYNPADTYYGGVYTLTTKEGIVYQIDAATGDLLTVTDTNGNKLTYTDADITSSTGQKITFGRDAQGRIATVTDPAGKQIRYDYNAQGDLVSVTDREGNTTRMEYDQERSHYLDKIIDPLGRTGVKNEYGDDGRLKYLEDVNGQKVEMSYDPNNSRQTVLDQLGHATTYEYDARGNILTEIDAEGQITKRKYDDNNYVLEETVISDRSGPNGFTTKYTYDSLGNQLTQEDALGNITRYTYGDKSRLLTETDALGRTTTNVYSRSGNLRSTTDVLGHTTGYDYDLRGQLRSVKDANGNVTTFDYDDKGNVTSVTDALNNVTTYTYNANGDKLTETRQMTVANGQVRELLTTWTYDDNGRMKTMTDAENHTKTYEYDKLGHQTAIIDALQHKTEYKYDDKGQLVETIYADDTPDNPDDNLRETSRYDAAGRIITSVDKAGRETRFVYDDVGRLIETLNPDLTPNDWDDNTKTRTEYYSDGLVKAEIDERGNRTEFRYDADGRQTQVIYTDDTPATLTDNPRTTYSYDKTGQRIAETDALNHITTFNYDDLGRLTKTEFNDKTYTTNEYDNLGRRIAMTDQNNKRTEYSYDALGRLTLVKNALQYLTEYGYNEVGNLISQTDANQHITGFEYDGLGHRTATILPLGQRSDTTYDAVGHVQTYTDFNRNTTTYQYDSMNWMTLKQFQDRSKVTYTHTDTGLQDVITFVDANGQTTATYDYDYNERDRLVKRTDNIGGVSRNISYTYDAANNRTSVTTASGTVNYTFDVRNRLDQVIENGVITAHYDYDAVSNLVRTTFANGTQEIRSYDDLNRLKYLENHKGDTILSSYTYSLDKVGNRTKVVEHDGRTVDYTYDDLYQLTQEKITDAVNGNRIYGYTYDKVGNRNTKSETVNSATTVTNYVYDANDQLLNDTVNQQIVANYTYDNNGNTLSKNENGITTEYTWNYENRLIAASVKDANGTTKQSMQYRYNDRGIRVAARVDGVETRYLIDEMQPYAQVLEEYSPSGAVQVKYVYGNDLIAQEKGSDRTFYHVDGLGSTRILTDATGSVVSTYDYEAYGELISSTGGVANKYLFAGEQFDENLEDYYNRTRYYDADTGRFTRRDTYEGRLGEPLSLHKYIYASDNPVSYVDPTGFFATSLGEANAVLAMLSDLAATTTATFIRTVAAARVRLFAAGLLSAGVVITLAADQALLDAQWEEQEKRIAEAAAASTSCGTPLFHYTDTIGETEIIASQSIRATATYVGADGFAHPPGAYATSLPPVGPFTQRELKNLYKGGNQSWDVSRFVMMCSNIDPFYRTGYPGEWVNPAPAGTFVSVTIVFAGINLMPPG